MLPIIDLETGGVVSDTDRSFTELEGVIERGLETVIEVGQALSEIRYRWRLFKREAGFDDFDTYCRERWGFSRQRAEQFINAAEVVALDDKTATNVANLSSIKNEAQVRELARVDPERRAEVWQVAVETFGDDLTAENVRQVAEAEVIPADFVEAGCDLANGSDKARLNHLLWAQRFDRSISRVVAIPGEWAVEDVAPVIEDGQIERLRLAVENLGRFVDRVEAARPVAMRVIQGGRA